MSDYTLSYTGAQVDQLLGRAGSAVTTQDQAMSSEVQATIRNNIGAASKTVETAVASLSANIVTLNSRMDSLSAYTSKVDELYDTTVPSLEASCSAFNSRVDKLDFTDTEYLTIARQLADAYSASAAYFVGEFCTQSGNVWECNNSIGSSGEAWNSNHWTRLGSV